MGTKFAESTLTASDLYGNKFPGHASGDLVNKDVSEASGGDYAMNLDLNRPAIFWVVLVGMLVVVRFLWERG